MEISPRKGLHVFLRHLASGADPSPGMERLTLLGVDQDGTVHVLRLFFSVPVRPYGIAIRILSFSGELPMEGLRPMMELPVASFLVRRLVGAVLRDYHIVYIEGIHPLNWQMTPCERAKNIWRVKNWISGGEPSFP